MKIGIKNYGPITNGSIDVSKDLTIICGENNSGKTYFSFLLYGMIKGYHLFNLKENFILPSHLSIENSIPKSDGDYFKCVSIKVDLINLIKTQLSNILESFSAYVYGSLEHTFPMAKQGCFALTKFEFELNENEEEEIIQRIAQKFLSGSKTYTFEEGDNQRLVLGAWEKSKNDNLIYLEISDPVDRTTYELSLSEIEQSVLNDVILKYLLKEFLGLGATNDIRLFSAERIAIDIFSLALSNTRPGIHGEIESTILQNQVKNNPEAQSFYAHIVRYSEDNYYSKPIKDSIVKSITTLASSRETGNYTEEGHLIERLILNGELAYGGPEFNNSIIFKPHNGEVVRIEYVSSMVKSLTAMVLYLKYEAKSNDVVVIDEPELCLNPKFQRILTLILLKAINKGLKIIISTHSDIILRELNILIMLSKNTDASNGLIKKIRNKKTSNNTYYGNYDQKTVIKPDRTKVFMFEKGTISEMECNDSGFEIPFIDEVISVQNEIIEEVYFTLF